MNHHQHKSTAFTLIELLVVLLALGALCVLIVPPFMMTRQVHGQLRDSTQVRGNLQGLVIWAQNNQDVYPTPSQLDVADATVAEIGAAKDTTGNVLSLLVYNGFIPTEFLLSPNETNGLIEEYRDYEFEIPSAALAPQAALWDPALHGTPMSEHNIGTVDNPADIGNNSYALAPAWGERRAMWALTWGADDVVIGNRGPEIYGVDAPGERATFDTSSNTLLFHGSRNQWIGNVGYNDNHVNFETRFDPEPLTYLNDAGEAIRDNIFFDEPDDSASSNALLGVWAVAGDEKEDHIAWLD